MELVAYEAFQPFSFHLAEVIYSQYELLEHSGSDRDGLQRKWRELDDICREHRYSWILERRKPADKLPSVLPMGRNEELPLKIEALGSLTITLDQAPVRIKRKASVRLLLYLIANRQGRIPQELLMEELFGGHAPESAQNQLYVALSVLRNALEPQLKSGRHSAYVGHSDGFFTFHHPRLDLDLDRFLMLSRVVGGEGLNGAKGIDGTNGIDGTIGIEDENGANATEGETIGSIREMEAAESLYRGDLLEEYRYESFVEPERERIRIRYHYHAHAGAVADRMNKRLAE